MGTESIAKFLRTEQFWSGIRGFRWWMVYEPNQMEVIMERIIEELGLDSDEFGSFSMVKDSKLWEEEE